MSDIFADFIERRRETRRLLDHFSAVVYNVFDELAARHSQIDPVSKLPIMTAERVDEADGSVLVRLRTSNMRRLEFTFQSNGDARVVQWLADNMVGEEYIDILQQDDGKTMLANETGEFSLHEYIGTWVMSAFEA